MRMLGVDLDGVLGDLAGSVIKEARKKFHLKIDQKSITCYNLQECTPLSVDQVNELFETAPVVQDMKPIKNARVVLGRLKKSGWQINIITDRFRGDEGWAIAKEWLEKNRFEFDTLNLVRARDKSEYAKLHHIEYFIEDNYDTVKNLSLVCKRILLLDKPYNQGPEIPNVTRVKTWQEIEQEISKPVYNSY
jgi:uncharacterized HAD superfamily protein